MSKGKNRIVVILGRKGTGKSTFAKLMFSKMRRAVVFDPMLEYGGGEVFTSFAAFLEYMKENYRTPKIHCICRFPKQAEYEQAIELCKTVGNLWLFIEELNFFLDSWSRDENFLDLIRFGRHYNLSIVVIAQRAAEIPKLFTSQADFIISFQQREPRDLAYLSSVSIIGSEGAEQISKLEPCTHPKNLSNKNYLIFSD